MDRLEEIRKRWADGGSLEGAAYTAITWQAHEDIPILLRLLEAEAKRREAAEAALIGLYPENWRILVTGEQLSFLEAWERTKEEHDADN